MAIAYAADHIHLRSLDVDAAARFYVEVLGGKEVGRVDTPDGVRAIIEVGTLRLFVETAPAAAQRAPTPPLLGIEHVGLRVDDLEAAAADLRARGVRFAVEPKEIRPGLKICFLDGPDNVRIEVLQRD